MRARALFGQIIVQGLFTGRRLATDYSDGESEKSSVAAKRLDMMISQDEVASGSFDLFVALRCRDEHAVVEEDGFVGAPGVATICAGNCSSPVLITWRPKVTPSACAPNAKPWL